MSLYEADKVIIPTVIWGFGIQWRRILNGISPCVKGNPSRSPLPSNAPVGGQIDKSSNSHVVKLTTI